jgi:hypothetical protein
MSSNEPKELPEAEIDSEREKTRFLTRLQWWLNITSGGLAAVAIGLYYADQRTLAQLTLVLIAVVVFGSTGLAYYRYNRNQKRRIEILTQLEKERDTQLLEVFNEARRERNLPPDAEARDGFAANIKAIEERTTQMKKQPPKKGTDKGGRG